VSTHVRQAPETGRHSVDDRPSLDGVSDHLPSSLDPLETSSLSVAPLPRATLTTSSIRRGPPNSTDADVITSRVLHRTRSMARKTRFRSRHRRPLCSRRWRT